MDHPNKRVHNRAQGIRAAVQSTFLRGGIFLLMLLAFFKAGAAVQEAGVGPFIQYLAEDNARLTLLNNEAKTIKPVDSERALLARIQKNKTDQIFIQTKMDNLVDLLANLRHEARELNTKLKKIQQMPLDKSQDRVVQEKIAQINALKEVNAKSLEWVSSNIEEATRYQGLLKQEQHQLVIWQAKFAKNNKIATINATAVQTQTQLNRLLKELSQLDANKKGADNTEALQKDEAKRLLISQRVVLLQDALLLIDLQKKRLRIQYEWMKRQDLASLQSAVYIYNDTEAQLLRMQQSLQKNKMQFEAQKAFFTTMGLHKAYDELQQEIEARLADLKSQQKDVQEGLEQKKQELSTQMSTRSQLTEYHMDNWSTVLKECLSIPSAFYNYVSLLVFKVWDNYLWQDKLLSLLFWFSIGFLMFLARGLHRYLSLIAQNTTKQRLSGVLFDGLVILLQRNVYQLTFILLVWVTFYLNHIPYANYKLLLNLLGLWLAIRSLILVARIALMERLDDASGQDARLFYRIKWLSLFAGWTLALMLLSHQLPLSLLMQDVFNRLFMLFLLVVSGVTWFSRKVIPALVNQVLETQRRYFRHAIGLLSVLIPVTLFITAITGLLGYINLAWTMGLYQIYLLMVLTAYILVRGIVIDGLELLSEWMVASITTGWLWVEVFLKPFDKIIRVLLILGSGVLLCYLYGLTFQSPQVVTLMQWGRHPLINLPEIRITFFSVVNFIILLYFFLWAAKWVREFSYRWFYRYTEDEGIRNSLSVFTQYAVIFFGGLITLRVLGLDFTGLSMILGGLAVGMGFGLRDFASNIVGGFMLLIERPVREGDLVTIGDYEGRVAHIGIRSMRVSSWDNMEVLIPNAETFNKPFTNWTHQDSIVRTVVPVKVSRTDDPFVVQQLIMHVLESTPEVLKEPQSQVLLKQIDEALIVFEVRYFVNLDHCNRVEVRSKVLFELINTFKTHGIKAPIPPLQVEMNP